MGKRVLIPLDGSPFAERVLAYLPCLGKGKPLDLVLVHVVESVYAYGAFGVDSLMTLDNTYWRQQGEEYLKRISGELSGAGYSVCTRLLEGDVATAICDTADADEVDMIAMTTHGRSGIPRWVMGSIADRVLRTAGQPIFLVRPGVEEPQIGPCKLLVPLDGSPLAERALDVAFDVLGPDDRLILMHSVERPQYWTEAEVNLHVPPVVLNMEQQQAEAEAYLADMAERLRQQGITVSTVVSTGHAAEAITETARQEEVGLIVMSTHGRSGLSRWVFGSAAEKVVRIAQCPVLVVPVRAAEAAPEKPNVAEHAATG